jgi:hypothetical protein
MDPVLLAQAHREVIQVVGFDVEGQSGVYGTF